MSKELAWLVAEFRGRCYWCRRIVNAKNATRDHLLPKSAGGTKTRTNLVLSCSKCNLYRGNSDAIDYAKRKKRGQADVRRRVNQAIREHLGTKFKGHFDE